MFRHIKLQPNVDSVAFSKRSCNSILYNAYNAPCSTLTHKYHWVGTMKVTQVTIIKFFVNKSTCLKWWSPEYGVAEGIQ